MYASEIGYSSRPLKTIHLESYTTSNKSGPEIQSTEDFF